MKSAYQTKINKRLAELSLALDPVTLAKFGLASRGIQDFGSSVAGSHEWKPVSFHYGHRDCELCNHKGIRRIFTIESVSNGNRLEIGSECAKNYLDADLVAGLCKIFDVEYLKIVNPVKFEDDLKVLEWAEEFDRHNRFSSLSSYRYKLINYGNPRNLAAKINFGKNIGKREKEALAFWKHIYENQEVVKSFDQWYKDDSEKRHRAVADANARRNICRTLARVLRNAQQLEDKRELYGIAQTVFENGNTAEKKNAKDVIISIFDCYDTYQENIDNVNQAYKRLSEQPPKQQAVNDVAALFKAVYDADKNAWEEKFVNSCYAYYRRLGSVSDKQRNVLVRIAKND